MSRFIAFVFLLALSSAEVLAEPAQPAAAVLRPLDLFDLGAPAFSNFSAHDGLPDSVLVSIATDRDGFVWVASPSGVARYDGKRWVASEDPAMAHSVDNLWVDRQGTLWAAFNDHGLAHYDGARWHVEGPAEGLPSQQIRRFGETREADGSDTLWALTWDQGLLRRRDGRWTADPDNAQLPRGALLTLAQTRELGGQPRQWVGSGQEGLWFREPGGHWRHYRSPEFDTGQIEYLFATEHHGREELWISVFGAGLWRLNGDGLQKWTREGGNLPTNDIYDIAETPLPNGDRAIWVSSRSGLLRVHDDRVQVFDQRHGLSSDVVRGLHAWRSPNDDQVLWLATESGVSRTIIGANRWLTASLLGASATGVFATLVEPDGDGGERLWVGASEDGLAVYDHGEWRRFNKANGALPDASVRLIAVTTSADGRRQRWVGLNHGFVLRMRDGPVFETLDTPWPQHDGEAVLDTLVRQVDGRDEQWFVLRQSGIYRLRDGRWTAFRPDAVRGQWRVGAVREQIDASGRSWLWAVSDQGLARFDGEQWHLFGREIGLADANLLGASLIRDAAGRPILWLGSVNAGIARVDLSDPQHPLALRNDLPPPPDSTSYGALQDSAGRIYNCTDNGVQQLTPAADGYRSQVFTRKDGMMNAECNANSQFIDAHDRFWTGTLGGLTVYDPRRATTDRQAKPLKIVGLRIDGKAVDGGRLRVHPAAKEIDVEYALLSWQREGESRFRTQLLGYEAAPGEWSAQNARSFNALPPGSYVLRIEARDYAGNASEPIELPIDVAARWWQRDWARVAVVVALLLLGYAGALLRTRALKAQRRSLEERVGARTAELNAANARLRELSYQDALTGLANRRRLLETLEQGPHGATTAWIFVDVDSFKVYNDRYGHPAGDEALRSVAATLRACAPADAVVARYGGEEFACLLPDGDAETAATLAERIRAAVAATDIVVPGSPVTMRVTISAGVACVALTSPDDAHRLLLDADMALYQAKRDGRNRVRIAPDAR